MKRVVRSTLAAEGYAVSEAAEQTEWVKQVLEEVQQPAGTRLGVVEKLAESRKSVVYTDSGSLTDTIAKDAGKVADRRFRIVVAMLRQMFEGGRSLLRWCNTKEQLADGLTKMLNPPAALIALMTGKRYAVPAGRTKLPKLGGA